MQCSLAFVLLFALMGLAEEDKPVVPLIPRQMPTIEPDLLRSILREMGYEPNERDNGSIYVKAKSSDQVTFDMNWSEDDSLLLVAVWEETKWSYADAVYMANQWNQKYRFAKAMVKEIKKDDGGAAVIVELHMDQYMPSEGGSSSVKGVAQEAIKLFDIAASNFGAMSQQFYEERQQAQGDDDA
eukprot:Sspe_Gene.82122::Locus_53753_Transcript_1_1_Confidence_1.000_Length_661::g.82122::m.82122